MGVLSLAAEMKNQRRGIVIAERFSASRLVRQVEELMPVTLRESATKTSIFSARRADQTLIVGATALLAP